MGYFFSCTIPQHFHQRQRWQATDVSDTILSAIPLAPLLLHVHEEFSAERSEDLSSGHCKFGSGIFGRFHRPMTMRIVDTWGGTEENGGRGCGTGLSCRVCHWVPSRTSIVFGRIRQQWDDRQMDGRPCMISTSCRASMSSVISARPNHRVWHIVEWRQRNAVWRGGTEPTGQNHGFSWRALENDALKFDGSKHHPDLRCSKPRPDNHLSGAK